MNAAKWMRWAIGCLLMVTIVGGVQAASEDIKITVPVETKKDAGIGFNYLTEAKVFDLQVDLTSVAKDIDYSRVRDIGGRAIWAPKSIEVNAKKHSYEAAGVKPNDGHAARFQGNLVKGGAAGGASEADFLAHLSDLDLDIDSDNDSTDTPRTPLRTDNEDKVEYVTGDVSPNNTLGLRATANTVIAMKFHLEKRKAGTLTVTATDVTFYSNAACTTPVNGWDADTAAGPTGLTAYMKVTANKDITATFTPAGTGNQGPNADETGKAEDKVKVLLDNGDVRFSPNPVVTGFKKADGTLDPKVIKKTVVATFSTPALAGNAKIVVTDLQERIETITGLTRDATAGTITFDVYGKTATAVSAPYGETTIKFTKADDSALSGEVQVIVVVPCDIGKPHPEYSGPAVGENLCVNSKTSPCYYSVLYPKVVRATYYQVWQTIPVWDQFDSRLDPVYKGQDVEEYLADAWRNMNQSMSEMGTYRDPVGLCGVNSTQLDPNVPADKVIIDAWPSAAALPMPTGGPWTVDFQVKVGGHQLTVGVVGRKISVLPGTFICPTNIKIEWP